MEDEFLKRCTDCVYFLASPFTCKKGAECEYRHSNVARLNPRDCWYWLSGTCANLMCPFRHPPLDVPNEGLTEAAGSVPYQSSVPATKTTVPCYYYNIGFCKKGDSCHFLHEPGDTFAPNSKVENLVADAPVPPLSSKAFGRSDTRSTHTEKLPTRTEMAMIKGNDSQVKQRQTDEHASIEYVEDQNTFVQTYAPECEETAAAEEVPSQPSEDSPESEPSLGSDQSSEEPIDGNVVQDEWWESSPGFDVLVDGQTQDMAYEDDVEYIHPRIESERDPDPLFVQYGFEADTDEIEMFNNGLYELSEELDGEIRGSYESFLPRHTQNKKARNIDSRKRKFFSLESPTGGFNNVDLRDHLRRKTIIDCHLDSHDLRHDLVQRRYHTPERFARHRPNHRLHGRLASREERNGMWLDRRISVSATNFRGLRNSQQNYNGMRRRNFSAEGQPRLYLKRPKYAPGLTKVTKPRGVTEIEKNRRHGHNKKNVSVDFEGPKPLSEILKEKKKMIICEE